MVEVKKGVNEDLIKPPTGKIDKFEHLMMQTNQLLTQMQGANASGAAAGAAARNGTQGAPLRPINPM